MPSYTISGRVVAQDGSPVVAATISLFERFDLTTDRSVGSPATTDTDGRYTIEWTEAEAPASPWDLFVVADDGNETAQSSLLCDLEDSATIDLVLGEGAYVGQSEWTRLLAKLAPLLGGTGLESVPADRIEWLSKRADVSPVRLGQVIQAHRLADGRTVRAASCYAFMRAGLPADMPGMLRAGEAAWEAALRGAWTRQIIDLPGDGSESARTTEVAREVDAMRELLVDAALDANAGTNHRALFDTAGLSEADQRTFHEAWQAHTGDTASFWTGLEQTLDAGRVASFRFTIRAASLVANHVPTLAGLQAERGAGTFSTTVELAAWSSGDWDSFLVNRAVSLPADLPGSDATEQRQRYAKSLARAVEDRYPTAFVRHSLVRDAGASAAPASSEHVATFLGDNASFDLLRSTLSVHLAESSDPWPNIAPADQDAARANVARLQRVFRLAPRMERYATTKALLDQGVSAAADVVGYTREEFIAQFAAELPGDLHDPSSLAAKVWDNATKIHALTIGAASRLALANSRADFAPVAIAGSDAFAESTSGLAELSTILGELDYCACEHCRSVFSPAAYLADLLHFLKKRPTEATAPVDNALEALSARRPDIARILLDCANTHTPLPHIDLVNELLEATLSQAPSPWIPWHQTTWTQEELRAHPEHLDASAYDGAAVVATAVHPWSLPFSLPTVEARVYLKHLGVERHALLERFEKVAPDEAATRARAGERLGLSALETEIVAGTYAGNTSADGREYWGFGAGAATDSWVSDLSSDVGELLRLGGYTLDELRALLALDFVNPDGAAKLQWAETCSLDDATVGSLDAALLDRLHRFTRLQRRSAIPARMLNVLLVDACGSSLDGAALSTLADTVALKARLRLDWDELACFWSGVIDARAYEGARSLYDRRVRPKGAEVHDYFNPVGDGELQGEDQASLGEHLEVVLPALQLREADYQRLVDTQLDSDALTFANLTALLRCALLAKALRLSVEELVTLAGVSAGLLASDPFASSAETRRFVAMVDGLRASDVTIAELDWLLRDVGEGVDLGQVGLDLGTLGRGLAVIEEECQQLVDPDGAALATNVDALFVDASAQQRSDLLAIVEGSSQDEATIDALFVAALDLDAGAAKAALLDDQSPSYIGADVPTRRAWLLAVIVSVLRRRALVVDTLSASLSIPAALASELAFGLLHEPGTTTLAGVSLMRTTGAEPPTSTWLRLAKAAAVCQQLELGADEVAWYSGRGDWLDLDALPVQAGDAAASFDAWNRLREALSLRSAWKREPMAHASVVGEASFSAAVARLAQLCDWEASALEAAATSLGYGQVADFENERALQRLRTIAETGARVGLGVDVLDGWASQAPDVAQATAIKAAARAKHDEASWAKVAAPLRDAIREQQRDALVDAVLATSSTLATRHDVFEHLLIDVEMSACMQTSRIKQAISAVQIYVQRVLLHLEDDTVVLTDDAIERWEWMKNYRVWEANRKVFLYPENWLEPELRGGKTPEFETLEATLMQGVLEDEPIEKALVSYVDRLDRVSRLEIVSVYEEEATGELWVLGRSAGKPYDWFVRRRRNGGAWQAWEEVPHKIDGDAVALVVEQRRAHLFWAEKQSGQQQGQATFRLSHIERSEDGWGKVTVSEASDPSGFGGAAVRLQVWKGANQFAIAVLAKYQDYSVVFALALFSHDLRDGDIRYRGAHLELSSFNSEKGTPSLLNNTLISLQPGYEFDGQRYVNVFFTSEPGAQEQGSQVIEGGTHFEQGTFRALLFADRSSSEDDPAMVHQADLWTSEPGDRFRPVVYDDRRRKYLLEPHAVYDLEDASPGALGLAVATDYLDECPPPRAATPPVARPPRAKTQALKDGLTTLTVWNGVVPGQVEGLEPANTYDAGTVLGQATAIPQAGTGPSDDQNNFPASQTAFTLGIEPLYHPYARDMVETLARQGLPGLYAPAPSSALFRQQGSFDPFTADELDLNPALVDDPASLAHSLEHFDFRFDSPYGLYNWELFFHVPMLVAAKLTAEQRFEEAQRWHHKVFNPIQLVTPSEGESPASGFWRVKPFVEQAAQLAVDQFQAMAGVGVNAAQQAAAIEAFTEQVGVWADNPFDPHAIARIRPGVYQRALLRKYLDNLIAWADQLFARDTIESINEATVLYILVAQLLGDRPQAVPGPQSDAKTFEELDAEGLDAFSNALIELESYIHLPTQALEKLGCDEDIEPGPWARVPVLARSWHFCYPPNAELLKYWDIVDDRLWKIRHCQNIRGVARSLPLFQPPIDPGLLVRATAAGVDIQSVLAELDSGLPPYRFRSVHGRAVAFAGSLRALGGELLSALEKRDAEALARLRSGHELELLDRVLEVREQQLEEARTQLSSLLAAKETVEQRQAHYASLIEGGLSEREDAHFTWAKHAYQNRQMAGGISALGSVLGAIPQTKISLTDPGVQFGGLHLSNVVGAAAGVQSLIAAEYDHLANKAQLYGSFDRRRQDWTLQRDQADKELARLEHDLIAAEIRVALAERELDNHKLQLEQSREYDQTMRDKFTNRELYDWMVGQLSTLYFQTYQLAFDLAKRAERAYSHELAITDDQSIIQYGYWDSLRKGLLAGQRLLHDLERLDLAYMDRDIREFELRKSASLAELDPAALRDLQEAGEASFELPELLYDLDHPGHYLRRIRAVRVTIPAVVGPYTSLGARLELEQHSTRVSPQLADTVTGYGGGEAIATSTAVADGGLFNLDFRDERYLPFEYAGAASAWKLTLPQQVRQFDYRTISDVVIHVDYTARDGGSTFRDDVEGNNTTALTSTGPWAQLLAIHDAFPNEWEQFLRAPEPGEGPQVLTIPLTLEHLDYLAQQRGVDIEGLSVGLLLADGTTPADLPVTLSPGGATSLGANGLVLSEDLDFTPAVELGPITLSVDENAAPASLADPDDSGRLDRSKIAGLVLIVHYVHKS